MAKPHLEPCSCGKTPRLSYDKGQSVLGTPWHREYVKCECGMQTKVVKRLGGAAKIWNRRAAAPPPVGLEELEAQVSFTLSDASRLLRKEDVEGACPHPHDCFYETDRVRCGPCGVKASAAKGIAVDDTYSNLPEVARLRRELRAANDRISALEAQTNMENAP